jgi:hypothetical protein
MQCNKAQILLPHFIVNLRRPLQHNNENNTRVLHIVDWKEKTRVCRGVQIKNNGEAGQDLGQVCDYSMDLRQPA